MAATRHRVLSIRLTPDEHAAWTRAAAGSRTGTLAAWARVVLAYLLDQPGGTRPGARPGLLDVAEEQVRQTTAATQGLNVATRTAHVLGIVGPEAVAASEYVARRATDVAEHVESCRLQAPPGVATEPRGDPIAWDRPRPRLVNVRATAEELSEWTAAAHSDGYRRASSWARIVIGAQLGHRVEPPPVHGLPVHRAEIARQLGGAITNAAQLVALAEDTGCEPATRYRLAAAHETIQAAAGGLRRVP